MALIPQIPLEQPQSFQAKKGHLYEPTVRLSGHTGEVYASRFSPCGDFLVSTGTDRLLLIWDVFSDQVKNLGICKGHKNAVLDVKWHPDSSQLHSCGADKLIFSWDTVDFSRIRTYKGHEQIINSISCTQEQLASGSDDCTVKLWDPRAKSSTATFKLDYQITVVEFARRGDLLFFGGLDNSIKALNLKKNAFEFGLYGHTDTITGL